VRNSQSIKGFSAFLIFAVKGVGVLLPKQAGYMTCVASLLRYIPKTEFYNIIPQSGGFCNTLNENLAKNQQKFIFPGAFPALFLKDLCKVLIIFTLKLKKALALFLFYMV